MTCILRVFIFSVIAVCSRVYENLHRYRIKIYVYIIGVRVVEQCVPRANIFAAV